MKKRCPISYELIEEDQNYSASGLKLLSSKLTELKSINLTAQEQRNEANLIADKMSIQGVQPKLSARLDVQNHCFIITAKNGKFILKPQSELYPQVPENEDLSMRMAKLLGIDVPLHGLCYSKDESLTYFIKRFDRHGHNKKYSVEDFSQLTENNRDTKYRSSMEKLVSVIENYCTFPAIEKTKLLSRVLFNFLIGNEDMHLKNFSLITRKDKVELAPAYDFLNSSILLRNPREQLALPLNGRKNNLRRKDFIEYYAYEKLQLNNVIVQKQLDNIKNSLPDWLELIEISFLSENMKLKYKDLLLHRSNILI